MIDDHYAELEPLYSTLGQAGDSYCAGNHDFVGWYNERGGRARMWCLGKEYGGIRQNLDRVMYATNTYVSADWFMSGFTPYQWADDGREWDGEKPMPGYGDVAAYAPFADIDLADDVKQKRPEGDIPQEEIESALAMYAEAFADLAGDMSHVFALDSVGGAYMFVAPTVTKPIATHLDAADRQLLFDDMMDKLNDWLADVDAKVLDAHPDLRGVFEADCVNNKNRLYKAPMSVHSSLDGVVTPVDPANPAYSFTPVRRATDAHRETAEQWADNFTSDHTDAVASLVSTLWPDYTDDVDGWEAAIDSRVADLRDKQEQQQTSGSDIDAGDVPDDLDATDDIDVVNAKIEAIDVRDVAKEVADEYDTADRSDPVRFDPSWRASSSGESCFVDRDKWVDLKEGRNGGGALKLVARADRDMDVTHSSHSVDGETYWKAVAKLRGMGFEIPRFKGKNGGHADYFGLYDDVDDDDEKRKQVAKALQL